MSIVFIKAYYLYNAINGYMNAAEISINPDH